MFATFNECKGSCPTKTKKPFLSHSLRFDNSLNCQSYIRLILCRNKGLRCKRSPDKHRRAMLADVQQLKYTLLKNLLSVEK